MHFLSSSNNSQITSECTSKAKVERLSERVCSNTSGFFNKQRARGVILSRTKKP